MHHHEFAFDHLADDSLLIESKLIGFAHHNFEPRKESSVVEFRMEVAERQIGKKSTLKLGAL
jgi:hypothetical protein